jgi:arylsulfatase A-like enzyme
MSGDATRTRTSSASSFNETDTIRRLSELFQAFGSLYKRWVHEGGIATPLIVTWPAGGLSDGSILRSPFQLTDLLPTVLDATGTAAPSDAPGVSMLQALRGEPADGSHALFWEHVGNAAAREGDWKIVRVADEPWELYNMSNDRSELRDLATAHPDVVDRLVEEWSHWADSVGVIPWDQLRSVVDTHDG